MRKLEPHHVLIEPVHDPEIEKGVRVPGQTRIYHPNLGYVRGLPDILDEALRIGDLVIYVGWKQRQVAVGPVQDRRLDWYIQHEDDIELVLEDWDDSDDG